MKKNELKQLVRDLQSFSRETEWIEFKKNNSRPEDIGEYISALSNAAALCGQSQGYILWGIDDGSLEIVGTEFRPHQRKKGNQELESWLLNQLEPSIEFRIHEGDIGGKSVVVFEIQAAFSHPVRFRGIEYVRVGSYKSQLKEYPEKERLLWQLFDREAFENKNAMNRVSGDDTLKLLDYPGYFHLTEQPLPEGRTTILERLSSEGIIQPSGSDAYSISNMGALLFARNLEDFGRLGRKALRVIFYQDANRAHTIKEHHIKEGYAVAFKGVIEYINDQLPQNEEIVRALRKEVKLYPEIAIRELVANALIHQDLTVSGAGPMVEIFSNRIEISNPGVPLIDALRFIDELPRSRNERIASLMRRMNICEERGSGIDKSIFEVELYQLPPPDFRVTDNGTIAVLFKGGGIGQMNREDRRRACYQHACLQYVSGRQMSNTSLRQRLGIQKSNYPMASRIIKDCISAGLIRSTADLTSTKNARYLPFWVSLA